MTTGGPKEGRPLPVGVYDEVLTAALVERLAGLDDAGLSADVVPIEDEEVPARLARHLARVVRRSLAGTADAQARTRVVEELVTLLRTDDDGVPHPPRVLRAVQPAVEGPGRLRVVPPLLGVGQSDLLVNGRGEPSLLHSLAGEIASADRIDVVVAFIRFSGLRPLLDALTAAVQRGARVRVLTTTYLGSTESQAVDALVRLGAQVRVSYDTSSTRLHAKAWIFERDTGFHTAYIGSSNLSRAATTAGQEWNVRLAAAQTPDLVEKLRAAFAGYWDDPVLGFEAYDPQRDSAAEARLRLALAEASGGRGDDTETLSPFAIQPRTHQRAILEDLDREREVYGRYRNLVVAATGTGKTAVAAFDYARSVSGPQEQWPSLLFVAHRAEILQQSRRMFRHVLRSGSFGEVLTGDAKPERWRHVFASVQSLTPERLAAIAPEAFDVVVVDEFHHAAAPSYRALLDHVRPRVLLGLTATPERMDGVDVTHWFDGHIASELRLWDALEQRLLSPFHYYGVGHDSLDFRKVAWSGGRYSTTGLEQVLTGDDVVMGWVIRQLQDKVADPRRMRALAFASSVRHAEFVAERLRRSGIAAVALDGSTPRVERDRALADLRSGAVQCVVTVDLFTEGVDVPAVDTLLLLRPTESVTVFLQQLGRGLRLDEGKDVLTVLDFIGFQDKRFRFDLRFRALTGVSRRDLSSAVREGFPYLPSGSFITLDAVAQEAVLENVRAHVPGSTKALVADVRTHAAGRTVYRLAEYLSDAVVEPADVYGRTTWTAVSRTAGLTVPAAPEGRADEEAALLRRVAALAHVDDLPRLDAYARLLHGAGRPGEDDVLATMLLFTLWPDLKVASPYDGLARLADFPAVVAELEQVWEVARERIPHATHRLTTPALSHLPLRVHARYSREEMLAGIGWAVCGPTPRVPKGHAAGTRRVGDLDVFDITWRKTEKAYSPTTMYADHAVSPHDVHWESPNGLTPEHETARRYVEHAERGRHVLLFAREAKKGPLGTQPLMFLGPATYVSHEGSRPVAFRWRLDRPMPTEFYETARVVAS